MNWIKVLSANLMVLFVFIALLEVGAGLLKLSIGRSYYLPDIQNLFNNSDLSHPCLEMKTDTFLSHVPNHKNSCEIKGGYAIDDYVVYKEFSNRNPVLLTLGGSTTSGFYQHISDGETWPKYLSSLVSDEYFLVNAGIGKYSSLQEFLKFVRDGSRFERLAIVISLNGINEYPSHSGRDFERKVFYPFLTQIQHKMNQSQMWVDQRFNSSLLDHKIFNLVPNIKSGLVNLKVIDLNTFTRLNTGRNPMFKSLSAADRWEKNVRRLNALVTLEGAKYFLFLQPTMGLEGPQSNTIRGTKDEELFLMLDQEYKTEMRQLYKELKNRCQKMSFCIDISDSVPPIDNNYNDPRHHNAVGNKKLAQDIYKYISKK